MASYGAESVSSGEVLIRKDLETPVAGRDILIVEDIVDTGLTLSRLMEILRERRPASLKVCAFLDKRERRRVPFVADYVGFPIPDAFVVGYGLDYNEQFRFLPDVRVLRDIA
jgi:hypoxanthine phosphoribosyltransferase